MPKIRQHLALKKRGDRKMILSNYRKIEAIREREEFARALAYKSAEQALKPIEAMAAQNAKMEKEIAEHEEALRYRQARKKLIFETSPEFLSSCPRYVECGASVSEIEQSCRSAHKDFLASHELTKADSQLIWLFLNNYPEADLTRPETWFKAWDFICKALAPAVPEPQYEEEQSVAQSEPVQASKPSNNPLSRDEQDQKDRQEASEDWIREMLPNCEEAIDSLEASSGLVMRREQRLELSAHFRKRSANSRRPIPPTVSEWRKTAFQLWGPAIGLTAEERDLWTLPEEAALSAADYAKKVGRINGYAVRSPIAVATNVRDL
jgi:hypothetical protein